MDKPIAYLHWSLHVNCPGCKKQLDLSESIHDPEISIAGHIFNNRWDVLKDWEVTCEHCEHQFKIEKVDY